jgi:ABC-type nitrate/sulfonate/bicarbonate transport system ATPase subunit
VALVRILVNDPSVLLPDEPLADIVSLTRISRQSKLITI